MTIDEPTVTLTITITTDENLTGRNNAGTITLTMPRNLADKMANIGSLSIFIDDEDARYKEVSSNCDYRIISIDFPAGSYSVDIVGIFAPSLSWTSNSTYSMPVNLDVVVDGKTYSVGARGFAKLCSWDFVKEEKKMAIHYADGYNLTSISVSIPKDLLGAPYAVIVDGKQLDMNNSRNFNQTEYELLNSAKYNDLSIHTDSPVKDIEIIGTTAIPEFGSILSLVIMAGVIGSVVILDRMRFRIWS
jgi:hypothetical protein